MGAQQSTSTEVHSRLPITGKTPEQYLKLATEFLRQSQEMTSGNVPMPLQFNHGQCAYVVKKLETAVRSAMDCLCLPSPGKISVSMKNWKLLVRLAMHVKSFIQECCKAEWIQAASMLMNAFEHVASLGSHLELCIWSFKNRNRKILGTALRGELTSISEDQDRRLTRSQALDQDNLLKKVEAALNLDSILNLEERQLGTSLLGRLEATVANNPIPDKPDLADLSFRDQVELLRKVEAALNSKSILYPELHQLATSLLGRLKIAVANRTPHTPNPALLPFWEEEEKRLDQEESVGTGSQIKCQLATSLLVKLRKAVAKIPDKTDSAQLRFKKVDHKSLKREKSLGKGTGAVIVYRVMWLGTPAAEKTIPEENEGNLPDFDQEVSILARLSHPNILPLLCYVKDELKCSIVLELMDKDLTALIKERLELDENRKSPRGFPFSVDESVDIMLQISEGMHYLHRERVLHKDLKSQNILVKCVKLKEVDVEFVHAKVADFGISKTKEMSITLSHLTCNTGTSRWMAPEIIHFRPRDSAVSETGDWYPDWYPYKCDVYSFGMVCYEILTGHVPFKDDTSNAMKLKVLRDERPSLPSHCPSCLRSMIKKCWRPEPMDRPSFAEICTELRFMKGSLLLGRGL